MTNTEFRNAVKRMRTAQKRYFETRSQQALNESKKLEQRIDEILEEKSQTLF